MLHRRSFLGRAALSWAGWQTATFQGAAAAAEVAGDPNGHLGQILERVRAAHDLPAMAAVAVRDGAIVAVNAVGVRKRGDATPVTVHDKFHLGSCTKSMTATLAAILIEEGRIDWQTTIADVLGKMVPKIDSALERIPLIQLLCHWSGITTRNSPKETTLAQLYRQGALKGPPREQRRRFAKLILAESPETTPGTHYAYSNLNYTIAGHMLETVAGEEWESLLVARLARPLKMSSVGFGAMGTPGKIDQPWQHWVKKEEGGEGKEPKEAAPVAIEPGPNSDNPPVLGPGGTAHMTASDWGRYLIAHVDGEHGLAPLLKLETWRKLHEPPHGGEAALGWFRTQRKWGGRVYNHNGTNNQNYAVVWISPERRLGFGVMTNQGGKSASTATDEVCVGVIREVLGL